MSAEQNTRIQKIFDYYGFQPEIDRLKSMGATEDMIVKSFKEAANPKNNYQLQISNIRKGRERKGRILDYRMAMDYYTNPEMPLHEEVGAKYGITGSQVGFRIQMFLKEELGVYDFGKNSCYKYGIHMSPSDLEYMSSYRRKAGNVKKAIYDKTLEKIMGKM
jgi:hypothetical protein